MDASLKILSKPILFPDQTEPNDRLVKHMGCQACWYFYLLAHKMMVQADEEHQIVLEGEPWYYTRFRDLKKSIAIIYGLPDPGEADKFWPLIRLEAARQGLPAPDQRYVTASPLVLLGNDQSKGVH